LTKIFQVSDALLKLQKRVKGQPGYAGYLVDIVPYAVGPEFQAKAKQGHKIIAPVSTLKYVDKSDVIDSLPSDSPNAIPKGSHWADETDPGTVVVIDQPEGQANAALGGILALRMAMRGVLGAVVSGRVRDLEELQNSGLPVSSTSLFRSSSLQLPFPSTILL
jgi:regulator of RNase E activity RraA